MRREHELSRERWQYRRGPIILALVGAIALFGLVALPSQAATDDTADTLPDVQPGTPDPLENPGNSENGEGTAPSMPTRLPTQGTDSRFTCQYSSGDYTVMYHPESRPEELFPWAVPQDMGGGWDAERRCAEISRRLEEYRPDGLIELKTSTENGYNIVCVTTEDNDACRIVFTVPPGQDPMITRDSVFQNLTLADSGQTTQGVNTFVGTGGKDITQNLLSLGMTLMGQSGKAPSSLWQREAIDLKPFLDPADGGTGTALSRGIRVNQLSKPGRSLNPEQFR